MAQRDSSSWTTRLGGNRTLVLGVMIVMLCLFTVDFYILPALGVGDRGGDLVQFSVHGRIVRVDAAKYQALLGDWQKYQTAQGILTRSEPRSGEQAFLRDLMMEELARDAGVVITDGTLREYIESHPLFSDGSGRFSARNFDEARNRIYGGLSARALEEQIRRYLLLHHFQNLYANSFLTATDDEAYARWKGEHPKLEAVCAWLPVSAVRGGMKAADVKPEEVEAYWKDEEVQRRHRLPRKTAFDALYVAVSQVDDAAYRAARRERRDDPDFRLREGEAHEFWTAGKDFDFAPAMSDPALLETLRAENRERIRLETEELQKNPPPAPPEGTGPGAAPAVPPKEGEAPAVDAPGAVDDFDLVWRHRIEKELWLRKLLTRAQRDVDEGKATLAEAAARWSQPGVALKLHSQVEPVDQYEVEKIPVLGSPNCPLRYALNRVTEADLGKVHAEVQPLTAQVSRLDERGWLVFVPRRIVPEAVPALDAVREKVVSDLLDERAREGTRARLEELRRDAEGARKPLEEAAKEKGIETAALGPFNEYTWRPPAPKVASAKDAGPAGDGWKTPERRTSAVMGRYASLRDTPVGSFSTVLDDSLGTGAYYLVQVKGRSDPAFEEMNQAQRQQTRRVLIRERIAVVEQELDYGRLREKLSLQIGGKPAPPPDEPRRRR